MRESVPVEKEYQNCWACNEEIIAENNIIKTLYGKATCGDRECLKDIAFEEAPLPEHEYINILREEGLEPAEYPFPEFLEWKMEETRVETEDSLRRKQEQLKREERWERIRSKEDLG